MLSNNPAQSDHYHRLPGIVLFVWLVINLLQSWFTGLFDDEALFWMYGMNPAWGYYEHPPAVGILIRAGYELLPGPVGLRLFFVLLSAASAVLIYRMAEVRNNLLFLMLLGSVLILHAGGFLAAPDGPLMFFTLLFFLVYKQSLTAPRTILAIAWGVIMACMIYSKYNGILVIFLTLLSRLALIRSRFFLVAAATAIFCFLPHIVWSFRNDHPTIYYHLLERNLTQHNWLKYFLEYIPGQLGIYGPLTGFLIFPAIIAIRTSDPFERALKFTACGIPLFFLLYSFRGQIEPNWTLPAFGPMIILTYRYFENRIKWHRTIYILTGLSVGLLLAFRVYLVYDFLHLPRKMVNLSELHGWREWCATVEKQAGDRPVVFLNNYQKASKYIFYTGKPATSLESFSAHRTQYHYWNHLARSFHGKEVMVVSNNDWVYVPEKKRIDTGNGYTAYYGYAPGFASYHHLPVTLRNRDGEYRYKAGTLVDFPVSLTNTGKDTIRFAGDSLMPSRLVFCRHNNSEDWVVEPYATSLSPVVLAPGESIDTVLQVRMPEKPGDYYFCISVQTGWLEPGRNMNYETLTLTE